MPIFARTRDPQEAVARAVITPAVATMVADGSVSDAEMHQLINLVAFSPIFTPGVDPARVRPLIDEIQRDVERKGHQAMMRAAANALSPALRETAMCFALRVALADGRIEEGEKDALVAAAGCLQISRAVFDRIFEVVMMMQRGPTA